MVLSVGWKISGDVGLNRYLRILLGILGVVYGVM